MITLTNAQATSALKAATNGINAAFASCGRSVDADTVLDLAQETIANVLTAFDPSKATTNGVDGYAYIAGKREALDYLRGRVSGGAQRRHDGEDSLSVTDDDGNVTDLDVADTHTPSAFDLLALSEREALLNVEIAALPDAQRRALQATLNDDDNMDGKTRVAKMRAIDTIVANLPKSLRKGQRSKNKGRKRGK